MAIYHCSVKVVGRSKGRSSVAAAAYRAGCELTDERTGQVHDYTKKSGVDHTEILRPEHSPEQFNDRSVLWNEVEKIEKRKDAQLCREVELAIPRELNNDQKIKLVQDYSKANFVDKGMIADIAIHQIEGDNPHAHILLTTREVTEQGFGKKNRDWNDKEQLQEWRQSWADYANRTLENNHIEQRIDHRTLKEQGIDRESTIHMGKDATAIERKGQLTDKGDTNRQIKADNEKRKQLKAEVINLKTERQKHQDKQLVKDLNSIQLYALTNKIRPLPIDQQVANDKGIREASEALRCKEQQYKKLQTQEKQAEQSKSDWQQKHGFRSKLYKMVGSEAPYVAEKNKEIEQLKKEQKALASDILASQRGLELQKMDLKNKYLPSHTQQMERANAVEQLAKGKAIEEQRQKPDRERERTKDIEL